jgi:hypothetical protein
MGMHGYFHQVSLSRLNELIADPDLVMAELYPDDRNFDGRCTVEKSWNAIQFMLQLLSQLGHFPEDSPFLQEGESIEADLSYGPPEYRTPQEVSAIAEALAMIDDDLLREAYRPQLMHEYNVYPDVWGRPEEFESNFEWIRQYFRLMVAYYQDAAARGNAMVEYLG